MSRLSPQCSTWILGSAVLAVFAGCVTPPPSGNHNANGSNNSNTNSNTNANTNTNGGPTTLTAAQRTAITGAVNQLERSAALWTAFSGLVVPGLDLSNPGLIGSSPGCPQSFWLASGGTTVITLEFGNGCAGNLTGGLTNEGILALRVTQNGSRGLLELENLVVDADPVAGSGSFDVDSVAGASMSLDGQVSLTFGPQSLNGTVVLDLTRADQTTVGATGLTLVRSGQTVTLDLSEVVFRPVQNDSFRPQSGGATFTAEGATLQVIFSAQTPTAGAVQVRVNGSSPIAYTLGT